jgi:hypothetical protein
MFTNPNPWKLKTMLSMPPRCTECGQLFELEVGFWYGTAYVSYAMTVLFSGFSFVFWLLTIGFSLVLYLYFFVSYNKDYKHSAPKTFDYKSEDYFLREEPGKPNT